ncbi:hypothetical protein H5410_053218 [Solanum commersonii]|uniref:Uncharacterized protein n=1 Tax=Solanum commersonii TaxID=4109 RepID=A0A9J5X4B2_SOLCO|nr:hypothetical protein H5410_053218 [Solanum commersonii]
MTTPTHIDKLASVPRVLAAVILESCIWCLHFSLLVLLWLIFSLLYGNPFKTCVLKVQIKHGMRHEKVKKLLKRIEDLNKRTEEVHTLE